MRSRQTGRGMQHRPPRSSARLISSRARSGCQLVTLGNALGTTDHHNKETCIKTANRMLISTCAKCFDASQGILHAPPVAGSQKQGVASGPRVSTQVCPTPVRSRPSTTQASSPKPSSNPHSSSAASSWKRNRWHGPLATSSRSKTLSEQRHERPGAQMPGWLEQ